LQYFCALAVSLYSMARRLNNSYRHIIRSTGLFGSALGIGLLCGLLRNKGLALLLSPEGIGLITLFNAAVKLVSSSTNFGLSMSAVKRISEAYEHGDMNALRRVVTSVRSWVLLTAILGMLVCVLLSPIFDTGSFSWGNHTLHYALLAPIVGMMAITGGEMAVLKGMHRLKPLARIAIYHAAVALVISVALCWIFGQRAIVPMLVLTAFVQMLITIAYSYKTIRLSFKLNTKVLTEGKSMVLLGGAFVLAGIFSSGASFLIRAFINHTSTLELVGLYNVALILPMTLSEIVFSSMESDYFPRLSAAGEGQSMQNAIANRQIVVSLTILTPMLIAFLLSLPVLIPLLYSSEFLPAQSMMQLVAVAMFFRAVSLPIAYIPLARGDGRGYLLMEAIFYLVLLATVFYGFKTGSLLGAGIALAVTAVIEQIVLMIYMFYKHGFQFERTTALHQLFLFIPLCLAYLLAQQKINLAYILLSILLVGVTTFACFHYLKNKSKETEE